MSLSNFELLKAKIDENIPNETQECIIFPMPISRTIGFRLLEIPSPGTATMEMETNPEIHANPMGTIHGGVLCDIADAAIGCAHWSTLKEGESFTSIDLKINFFRPLWKSKIKAIARAMNHGKTISYYVCNITRQDDEKLIATVTSTLMTLRGEAAEGR